MGMLIFLQKPTRNHDWNCQINLTVKLRRFSRRDIENVNQVTSLAENYKKPTRDI